MDDLIELVVDFVLDFFVWEKLNEHLRKRIENKYLCWIAAFAIYLLIFGALMGILLGIYLLFTN